LPNVIGIGGVSNSGKSKLAGLIKSHMPGKEVTIICQDDHVYPEHKIPRIRNHIDWEIPASIKFTAFKKSIQDAARISDLVIAEGLFCFYDPSVYDLYDKKIFIEIPKEIFYERKRKDKRWGKEPGWYIDHIWKSFLHYGKPEFEKNEFLIIDGSKQFDLVRILSFIGEI
jgi:uridine kinase